MLKYLPRCFPGWNSNLYYSLNTFVYIAGCFGHPIIVNGPAETFGINATQYQNVMVCNWTILVETSQVSCQSIISYTRHKHKRN